MKTSRSLLLVLSGLLVVFLLAGGMAVKVGAGENTYHQALVFSEVLSLVLDNYVDPVEAQKLLNGAYEGMLGGLDAHGAFLDPEEVTEWKASGGSAENANPGITVLKAGRGLQVVAVAAGSPAEEAGIRMGDQIRAIDGRSVRDLSLGQSWRLICGKPKTTVRLDLLHPADGFRREEIDVERAIDKSRPYDLTVRGGVAVLRVHDLARVKTEEVREELDDVRSRGIEELLVDVRNLAAFEPRWVATLAGLFVQEGTLLRLRDRSGRLLETLELDDAPKDGWSGEVSVLVNGATAGAAEALASLIRERDGLVLGEATYGLGAEPKLYELEDGSGLVVSSSLWETARGFQWNGEGLEPDHVVRGTGDDLAEMSADQLDRALSFLERREAPLEERPEAA